MKLMYKDTKHHETALLHRRQQLNAKGTMHRAVLHTHILHCRGSTEAAAGAGAAAAATSCNASCSYSQSLSAPPGRANCCSRLQVGGQCSIASMVA
jgi:hypothetical protein